MISQNGSFTGAPLYIERLAHGVASSNYRVVMFFSGDGPIIQRMRNDGFEVFYSRKRSKQRGLAKALLYRLIHYFRFFVVLRLIKPDIVYSNTIANCGEVFLGKVCGFQTLVHMHEGMGFARSLRRRLALQAAVCDEIFVGSEYAGRVLYSLTKRAGRVLPVGINEVPFNDQALPLDKAVMRFGILGTLCENKGQILALEALSLLITKGVSAKLIIAGAEADKKYENRLRSFVADNGLEGSVLFHRQLDSVDTFFRSIDVLTICSYDEVFPTVILEGMREMKLIVATRVGGIPEIIENGATGFLYEPGDPKGLAECMLKIVGNTDVFAQITQNAKDKFVSHYGMGVAVSSVLKNFELNERT